MLDACGDGRVDVAEVVERACELTLANRLRPLAELRQHRLDVELAIPAPEARDLLLDDALHLGHLVEPRRHGVVEADPQVVDVEETNACDLTRVALDVTRHCEIDDHERSLRTSGHRRGHRAHRNDHFLRRGRRHDDVRIGERILELRQRSRVAAESRGRLDCALPRSVRNRGVHDLATRCDGEGLTSDAPRADDDEIRLAQVAEDPLGERERHRAGCRRIRADAGLRARAPAGRDRRAEQELEPWTHGSPRTPLRERGADLTEDLGLAEHERVEAGRHAAQVTCDVLTRVDVEMVEQELARNVVRGRERVDELVAGVLDAAGQPGVQLDPITGLERRVLAHDRAPLRAGPERAEPLAQLDGSSPMTETQADERVHAERTLPPCSCSNASMRTLGIDVGGTFTDAVFLSDGRIRVAKVPSGSRQEESVVAAAREAGAVGVGRFTHGTTIATNALLERRGAKTALVTNEGFEHVLHLRRQTRAHLYRPCAQHPPPLVPLERSFGVRGRTGQEGELVPLDLGTLPAVDAEAIAVSLLFSFRDSEPERAVAAELRRRHPDAHVVASHEIAPEFREYERASTTAVDAYLGPVLSRYLVALADECEAAGLPEPLVMRSSGGLATLDEAAAHAAFALLSGPAAGVVGAARIAELAGFGSALSFDMGGTSTDVCAIVDGVAQREHERLVGGLPVRLPTIAVHTVGAGGGSNVRLDEGGALRVGPESAGAEPGPACYGRGGTRATVTDANLLLGRLPAALPGGIELDRRAAEASLAGIDPSAVIDVVNAEMVRALRVVSVEQGLDPRDFALVAFGGAGPLHACALAEELGMTTVLVPAAAGVLSALGLVAADERRDSVRTYVVPLDEAGGLPDDGEADLRYAGQSFELTVPLGLNLEERFHEAHEARYGYADRARPIELVAVRTADVTPAPSLSVEGPTLSAHGPEVLELDGATAWVPGGWAGDTDAHGTLVLRRSG